MTNPTDNQQRKAMIQKGFDTVASGYDHPSLSFFPETAKRLVEHLQLNPTDNLLDVCTGTGVVALTAAEKLTQGKVIGIDLSSGMLQQATNKAIEKGYINATAVMDDVKDSQVSRETGKSGATDRTTCSVEFLQMDLEHLEFTPGSFDIATSSFGLFFLEDMTAGLTNIASTVRPGGKVAITSFASDAFTPMSDIFVKRFESMGRVVPPLSWKRLGTKELVIEQFNAVGITKVEIHHEPLGYQMTDPQQWWDVVWNAGWRSLLNQLEEEEKKAFEVEHIKEISDVLGRDGVWFNTEVLIAVGEK